MYSLFDCFKSMRYKTHSTREECLLWIETMYNPGTTTQYEVAELEPDPENGCEPVYLVDPKKGRSSSPVFYIWEETEDDHLPDSLLKWDPEYYVGNPNYVPPKVDKAPEMPKRKKDNYHED